ncbi:hypothetical protein KSD_27110 [Ktedonobacter sp. SOSP1-85]|nr:hypothetical protein KSD_27110 [Ktedonobacter sp. SOSP1-85]
MLPLSMRFIHSNTPPNNRSKIAALPTTNEATKQMDKLYGGVVAGWQSQPATTPPYNLSRGELASRDRLTTQNESLILSTRSTL